jgi:Carboxypeptidase regulatory-like domain
MSVLRRIVGPGVVLAALALLGLAGCNGNPAAPQGNYGTIMGVVKSSSGQPIANATVTADFVVTTHTDANGKYTLQQVPIDSSTTTTDVSCSASGFQNPPDQHVSVSAGKQYEVDFSLSPS